MKLVKSYKTIIKNEEPDVIITYTIKPNIYMGVVSRKKNIVQLANVTGLGTTIQNPGILGKFTLLLYRFGLKKAKVVFFQNRNNLDFMRSKRIVDDNYILLPGSGVDLKKYSFEKYPKDNGEIVFLIIGRLMKDKGTDEILEASKIIKQQYSNVVFRFIGYYDGDYKEKIDDAVKQGNIEYIDNQEDIRQFIRDSHATIHASYHEGMSNVLQETAATGRPVIASNIPGCIETFEPYVSGIPFEPRNTEDLVRAIKEFVELPYNQKAEMGIAGRKRMEDLFDRQIVVNKYLEVIEKEI